jgi:hypothetical protein
MAALRAALALSCALAAAQAQLIDDWLVTPPSAWPAPTFERNADASWTLSNGLVSRTFVFEPAFGTVDFFSHARGASLLRAIDVEGYIGLDGTVYPLGGIIQTGTHYHAFINRSDTGIQVNPAGWNATGWALGPPTAPFPWTPGTRGSPADAPWPPVGLTLSVTLAAPASAPPAHRAVSVTLHYQLVVGVPLLTQWVSVNSTGAAAAGVVVTSAAPVSLRVAQPYSPLSFSPYPPSTLQTDVTSYLYVETDEPHGTGVWWADDSAVVASPGAEEAQLVTNYTLGPGVVLSGGGGGTAAFAALGNTAYKPRYHDTRTSDVAEFVSFRTFLMVTDTSEPERFGLCVRRLYRLWAPQIQENPVFMHATDTSETGFKLEVDQMKEVGFEMLIYSFGTPFNLEDTSPATIAAVGAQIAYAKVSGHTMAGGGGGGVLD